MTKPYSERSIVFLVGAVQFINILDFMMVMPLGPDFARALDIPLSTLGLVGGSYTASAAVSGVLCSFFLDRFDRRKALAVAMMGLVLGTAAGGFATGLPTLMAARLVAGFFGGPATALSFSIIADLVPAERRGKALGAVMGAFSIASVVGVPIGLELSRLGGWRLPFFAVAGLGLVLVAAAIFLLPPVRGHLDSACGAPTSLPSLLRRADVRLSYAMTAVVMMAGFLILPNIAAYLQQNLSFPRERLGSLYMIGGVASFFTLRLAGRAVDAFGSFRVGTVAAALLVLINYLAFVSYPAWLPVTALFVAFMFALGIRNVAYNTLATKVPGQQERARFMSIQSAVQHLASAAGAFLSAQLLWVEPDLSLGGVTRVALLSMGLTAVLPLFLFLVEKRVLSRARIVESVAPQCGLAAARPAVQTSGSHRG